MLLKRIDETISQNRYDLGDRPPEVEVFLAEPSLGEGIIHWGEVAAGTVPRRLLHYNDAADSSNHLNNSWQKFYASEAQLGERPLYNGSAIYFSNGFPNFGGVAKAAVYLRYSKGFLDWLAAFDAAAADRLRLERPAFEAMMANSKTKKLPKPWYNFEPAQEKWPLLVLCRLSDARYLVHWLKQDADEDESLTRLGIDVPHSRELMGFLTTPEITSLELITAEFQFGSGLGRNAFGREYKLGAVCRSEYQRLMGTIPENSRAELLELWSNKLEYSVKVAPSLDTSSLIFLPEGELGYRELKEFIDHEKAQQKLSLPAKKPAKGGSEDAEPLLAARPELIPVAHSATVFLTNVEGGEKKKRIVQQVFPAVSLVYLQALNAELLNSNLQYAAVEYMKAALTGQDGATPSVYRYWTTVFTNAMQRQPISAQEVFRNFQRFAKSHSGEKLIGKLAAQAYFRLIGKLLRLQHLITTARTNPDRLCDNKFQQELTQIEQFNGIKTGVFGPMSTTIPSGRELIGEAYDLLRDKQKSKLDRFVRQAWAGVPDSDFAVFVRGALTGMLLNELCWHVQREGRRFSVTQGRHPSRLRGDELLRVFDQGIGLLLNLDSAQSFNCRLLPFLKSLGPESRRDSFNSGLITGMVYFEKKSEDTEEEEQHD